MPRLIRLPRLAWTILCTSILPSAAHAGTLGAERASLSLDSSFHAAQGQPAPAFGDAGSWWWSVGGGGAIGGRRVGTNVNANIQLHYFIVDDFEMGLEFGGWLFDQPGGVPGADDAIGANFNLNFRWHFIDRGPWTVFAEAGAGVLGASNEVPNGGTEFNFTPRAGLGMTRSLGPGGARLMVGARWQHISNARIDGSDRNPGEDAAMAYASVVFPF